MKLHLKMIIKNKLSYNKKALSMIVSTLVLSLLVVSVVAIIWGVVGNMVDDKIEDSASCFNIFGKVSINDEYTCYNPNTDSVQFSINIRDIDIDGLVISLQGDSYSRIVQITNTAVVIPNLENYGSNGNGFGTDLISLPSKNGGDTYVYYEDGIFVTIPNSIKIMPIIGDNICEIADTLEPVQNC